MRKCILFITMTAAVGFGLAFLESGDPDCLYRMFVLLVFGLALWLDYEMDLADRELEEHLLEWEIPKQERTEILTTRHAVKWAETKLEDIA